MEQLGDFGPCSLGENCKDLGKRTVSDVFVKANRVAAVCLP